MSIETCDIESEAKNETSAIKQMVAMVGTVHIVRKRPARRKNGTRGKRPSVWGNPLDTCMEPIKLKKREYFKKVVSAEQRQANIDRISQFLDDTIASLQG